MHRKTGVVIAGIAGHLKASPSGELKCLRFVAKLYLGHDQPLVYAKEFIYLPEPAGMQDPVPDLG